MIDWILAGVLSAVLMAEIADAWVLRQLEQRCTGICVRSHGEQRLVRWYAEGFDHSTVLASWLRGSSLALTACAVLLGAHPLVIGASLLLAAGAHGERYFSQRLRERFMRAAVPAVTPGPCVSGGSAPPSPMLRHQVAAQVLFGPAAGSSAAVGADESHVAAAGRKFDRHRRR